MYPISFQTDVVDFKTGRQWRLLQHFTTDTLLYIIKRKNWKETIVSFCGAFCVHVISWTFDCFTAAEQKAVSDLQISPKQFVLTTCSVYCRMWSSATSWYLRNLNQHLSPLLSFVFINRKSFNYLLLIGSQADASLQAVLMLYLELVHIHQNRYFWKEEITPPGYTKQVYMRDQKMCDCAFKWAHTLCSCSPCKSLVTSSSRQAALVMCTLVFGVTHTHTHTSTVGNCLLGAWQRSHAAQLHWVNTHTHTRRVGELAAASSCCPCSAHTVFFPPLVRTFQ